MGMDRLLGPWALCVSLMLGGAAIAEENPVLRELFEQGVPIPDGAPVKLAPPTLNDEMDPAAQMAAIKQVAQPNHTAQDLLRRSPVAPFTLDIKAIGATGQSKVESVDFWFAAYGSWQVANSGEFLQSVLKVMEQENPENKLPKSLLLTPQQLSARKIQVPADTPELEQKWYHTTFALFDRVQVSSTRWTAIRRLANSTTLAVKIDPRLAGDPEYPDQWRSITRTDSDQIQFGPPQPYVSAGFYLKATRLIEPAGAMFIECHMIFDEPRGWFGGANLLRSKLPLAVQEEVRNFRRRLSAASQGK